MNSRLSRMNTRMFLKDFLKWTLSIRKNLVLIKKDVKARRRNGLQSIKIWARNPKG